MITLRQEARESRRGTAMVLVVMVLSSLMFLAAAMMMVTGAKSREADSALDDARAFYLAEAGLAEAVAALEAGATGDVGNPAAPVALGDGVFWVDATPQAGGETRLVVTAMAGSGRAAVDVVLEAEADPLFQYTLNSKDTLTMNADVTTDSYDSSLGTHASQIANIYNLLSYANDGGDVASNSDIVLNARAHVFGDAVPGPGKSVTFATDSYVSGSTTPSPLPFSFPPVTVPTIPPSGAYSLGQNTVANLPAGKYDFTTFELQKSATLTIQGPAEIVVDDFVTYNSAKLLVDATNGPVTFYVEGTYTHGKDFEADAVPGSQMALAFMIEGTQSITFPSSAKVRGGYYAPNADILFTNYCEVWGAVAGNRIDMAASMAFHYDEALARYWEEDTGGSNSSPVIAWLPTSVTPTRLATDRRDPYQVLGIAPAAATTPEQGWVW